MAYDKDKVDDMVLALMSLVFYSDKFATRAWKGFDWDSLNRLYEKGFISHPIGKAKSVVMTPEGIERSKTLFKQYFSL
jgi:hypothetical protein